MPIVLFVLARLLFIASMVFIIGYVFGNFSNSKVLTRITRVAAILAIVMFISTSVFFFRFGHWRQNGSHAQYRCAWNQSDSATIK